jgi:hypothetical protein
MMGAGWASQKWDCVELIVRQGSGRVKLPTPNHQNEEKKIESYLMMPWCK